MTRLGALLALVLILSGCTAAPSLPDARFLGASMPAQPQDTSFSQPAGDAPQPLEQESTASPFESAAPTLTQLPPAPFKSPTPAPSATPGPYVQGKDYFPPGINPLTGLRVEDPALLRRRPIVIKVTNFPRSVRPQWGLSRADHVYEYYIGDAMSRFIGVFYGQDASRVGPIRSARLFDEHVMRTYQGIFIFGWADDPILEPLLTPDLIKRLVVEHENNCPPLCRFGPKGAYNTLFADTAAIGPYLENRGTDNRPPRLTGLRFEQALPPSGSPGTLFSIQYSAVSYHEWRYDPAAGRYLRFQETGDQSGDQMEVVPLADSLTGEQLAADNVLVLMLPHNFYLKSSSTEILDQVFVGGGPGYAFRDGQIYPITWSHPNADRLPTFNLPNGFTYPLKPGTVWFEVLSPETIFEALDGRGWRFNFHLPEPTPTATPTPGTPTPSSRKRSP